MYEGLSCFYDALTGDIPYEKLARAVHAVVSASRACRACRQSGGKPILLDAACGTGKLLQCLYPYGYDCIGLDISREMLSVARENMPQPDVLWLCQDMCGMDLYGTVTAICCMTDGVNHITGEKALRRFFARAHNFLDPGGVLLFDVLTESRFAEVADLYSLDDGEAVTCFWTGRYSVRRKRCVYDITCFRPDGDGRYTRTDDRVTEQVWSAEVLGAALRESGFARVEAIPGAKLAGWLRRNGAAGEGGTAGGAGLRFPGKTVRDRVYYVCEKES